MSHATGTAGDSWDAPTVVSETDDGPHRDAVAVQAKFAKWLALKEQGINFNERLVSNPAFHNPNIAIKMLEFVGVNEHGTNFSTEIYDPNDFPEDADYEAMAQEQRLTWEEANKPKPPVNVVTPYHLPAPGGQNMTGRNFVPSKKHQIMMERFYSRDGKK